MKNSIQKKLVKKMICFTCCWIVVVFVAQILLSCIYTSLGEVTFTKGYVDLSRLFWNHEGEDTIFYTDIIRILCTFLLFIPYVFIIMHIVNKIVVRPLKEITKGLEQFDYHKLDGKITVKTQYEFTELKDAFNELLQRVEAVEKQKNLMLTGMAHDIKTPITTIRGYAQALRDDVITDEIQKQEYLDAINRKSIQLDQLVSVLFDYAKFATTQVEMNFTQVDLCEVIRENLGLYYTEFEEKGIEFKFELPEQKVMIQADKRQISRVFANLYSNALKYNHEGDQVSTILVIGDRIRVVIKDTGEPIPKQIKQYIFEPFVTGDSSRKSGSGTGLGLSITKKIIELHGGAFELMEDEFEKSFVIYLDHHIE